MSARWYAGDLPTLEEIRRETLRQLGDAADTLRSDGLDGTGPNPAQGEALSLVRQHIALAKEGLDEVARLAHDPEALARDDVAAGEELAAGYDDRGEANDAL